MKLAKWVAWLGFLSMTAVLVYGFGWGHFSNEGSQLLSMPWGIVSMADLYSGFILFGGWIVYREKSTRAKLVWVVLLMVLGFWAGSLYALVALYTSHSDWKKFWMGDRATSV